VELSHRKGGKWWVKGEILFCDFRLNNDFSATIKKVRGILKKLLGIRSKTSWILGGISCRMPKQKWYDLRGIQTLNFTEGKAKLH